MNDHLRSLFLCVSSVAKRPMEPWVFWYESHMHVQLLLRRLHIKDWCARSWSMEAILGVLGNEGIYSRGWVSSCMEVSTDMCPEWLPFSGLEIYLSVYFFRPSCMIDQICFTRDFRVSKLVNKMELFLNILHTFCSVEKLKTGVYILHKLVYTDGLNICLVPFSSCPYIWMGWVFGLSDACPYRIPCPLIPPSPHRASIAGEQGNNGLKWGG